MNIVLKIDFSSFKPALIFIEVIYFNNAQLVIYQIIGCI